MILLDTNILARGIQVGHNHQQAAIQAISFQREMRGETVAVAPQTIVEFYVTCTRNENGLGLTPEQTLIEIKKIKQDYPLLPETPELFAQWELLVAKYKPANRRVFDTRHVAFMLLHKIPKILTFNDKDFIGYTEIEVLNPFDVLNLPRL